MTAWRAECWAACDTFGLVVTPTWPAMDEEERPLPADAAITATRDACCVAGEH